jgi:ribosomal-protein-alanine N-acetyltransferase
MDDSMIRPDPSMTNLSIRRATLRDLDTLVEIDRLSFRPAMAYDGELLGAWLRHPSSIAPVAETDGSVAGFAIAAVERGTRATLITIDVLERFRGLGVGSALLAECEKELRARGVGRLSLQVETTNEAAVRFYVKRNFTRVRTLFDYYEPGADAYQMALDLTGDKGG